MGLYLVTNLRIHYQPDALDRSERGACGRETVGQTRDLKAVTCARCRASTAYREAAAASSSAGPRPLAEWF